MNTFLEILRETICNRKLNRLQIEVTPFWVSEKDLMEGCDDNWYDLYTFLNDLDVPRNETMISSSAVYKLNK